jgi:trehalose 6-phosphate synthase/phosphatase
VTPLRDGMNLVAKEFVASRVDGDGVLLLSEFAGAAAELDGAMVVNPYDVDAVAASVNRALTMSVAERRARMQRLRQPVFEHDVHAWARTFLAQLEAVRPVMASSAPARPEPSLATIVAEAQKTKQLRLLLDYDGTLVPLARSPELAAPDAEILSLLEELAASPGVHVDILSGRTRETLEAWFGKLPVALWAEHGFWHRARAGQAWQPASCVVPDGLGRVRPIFEQFTASTPGSHVEVKSASLAWHYRLAQREFGARQAHELRMLLGDALSNQPWEVLEGKKVIEVRLRGVSKALVGQRVQSEASETTQLIAFGDDRTDDELFRALPLSSVTVAVGTRPTDARFRVANYRAVRQLLRGMVTDAGSSSMARTQDQYDSRSSSVISRAMAAIESTLRRCRRAASADRAA